MSTISPVERNTWDNNVVVTRDGSTDATWDGKVKMLVYDTGSMTWIAYTPVAGVGGAGDASAANQVLQTAKLTSIDGKLGSLGQKAMAGSAPVVIASDQTALPVTGPVTDTQMRATALPVSIASMPSTPVTGPLTDTQLRNSAVPMSLAALPALVAGSAVIGHVIVDTAPTTAVTGPLTDTQMRATAVPISAAALPLPSGAATESTLATLPIAQGAALGTNKQLLQGAAVSANGPNLTDGVISPLSLTLAGRLRVDIEIEARRAVEAQLLAGLLNNQNAILAVEQASVGHYGFELR